MSICSCLLYLEMANPLCEMFRTYLTFYGKTLLDAVDNRKLCKKKRSIENVFYTRSEFRVHSSTDIVTMLCSLHQCCCYTYKAPNFKYCKKKNINKKNKPFRSIPRSLPPTPSPRRLPGHREESALPENAAASDVTPGQYKA